MAQVETSRVRLKYLGCGFLALVFMIGTLAGLAGGFLARLAAQTDMGECAMQQSGLSCCIRLDHPPSAGHLVRDLQSDLYELLHRGDADVRIIVPVQLG